MMKSRKLLIMLFIICIGLCPALLFGVEFSEYGNPFVWVSVGQVGVKAEVVRSSSKIYLGLGHRRELPEGQGMLFIMPRMEPQNFCMRGMQFPIDIIWIAQEKIVGLEKNVSPEFTGTLCSPQPVKFVLEVPGGFSDRYGLKKGDKVIW